MSWQAPKTPYVLQNQQPGVGGQQGAAGPQGVHVLPATAEVHYAYNTLTDGTTNSGIQQVDGTTSATLANRVSIEFYNAGAQPFEVDTDAKFGWGTTGRRVETKASFVLGVGPANVPGGIKHYARCTPGQTCDLRVTEVGQ